MPFLKKMRFAVFFFVLGFVGTAIAFWYFGTHTLIRTQDDFFWASHPEFTFEQCYLDVREWGPSDFLANPEITRVLVEHGYDQTLESAKKAGKEVKEEIQRGLEDLSKRLDRATEK